MDKFIRKTISNFKKNTFFGFIYAVLDSAKEIKNESIVPFVAALQSEYELLSEAMTYEKTDTLTADINSIVSKADADFSKLNNTVKAIAYLDVDGTGAKAQAVKDIITKGGYTPSLPQAAKFAAIQNILDEAGKIEGVTDLQFGVVNCANELYSLVEQFNVKNKERKALMDARKAKFKLHKKAASTAFNKLIDIAELLLEMTGSEELKKFQVQVNETLIRIYEDSKKSDTQETEDQQSDDVTTNEQ